MTLKRLAIWGVGGHSRVVADTARALGWTVDAFIEAPASQAECSPGVIRATSLQEALSAVRASDLGAVALGFGQCVGRSLVGPAILDFKFVAPAMVHPSAVVSPSARLGRGVYIGAGAVVESGAAIGDFAIVNSRAVICHDSTIGVASHVCPGAVVAGACAIGDRCWIGAGCTVRDHIRIMGGTLVGCGSVVVKSIDSPGTVFGNPARYIKPAPRVF